jgi:hypothetical protein
MTYREGSEQYMSRTLKKGDNPRFYEWSTFSKSLKVTHGIIFLFFIRTRSNRT